MKRNLLLLAWSIARNAAKRFGGKARQYLSGALKAAWASVKASVKGQSVYTMPPVSLVMVDRAIAGVIGKVREGVMSVGCGCRNACRDISRISSSILRLNAIRGIGSAIAKGLRHMRCLA